TPRGAKRAHAVRTQTADRRDEAGPAALRTHRVGALLRPAGTNLEPRTANREPRTATPEPAVKILYSAIDQPVPGTTGGSVHVAAVAEGLAALGHDVTALVTPGVGTPPPSAVRWIPMRPPFRSTHLRPLRSGAAPALARGLRPDAIIERYHNFGGEAIRLARSVGAVGVLEVNAPAVDHPGSSKRLIDGALLVEPMRRWRERLCSSADL